MMQPAYNQYGQPVAPNPPSMPGQYGYPQQGQGMGPNPPSMPGQYPMPGPQGAPPSMPGQYSPSQGMGQKPPSLPAHFSQSQPAMPAQPAPNNPPPRNERQPQPRLATPPASPQAPTMRQLPPSPPPVQVEPTVRAVPAPQPQPEGAFPPGRLFIEVDGQRVGEVRLNKPVLTVGRLNGRDIVVPDKRVSRLHAKVVQVENGWGIEDAESVNGVIYKGDRVKHKKLLNGDCLYLAPDILLRYEGV